MFAPARESACLRVNALPRLTEGGCQGASKRSVDRRHGGDRGQSTDTMAWGQDSLPAGHERWSATEGWVSRQGINGDEGNKGQRGAAERVAERGAEARLELSVRQIQGLHYGGIGAGTAARSAP